MNRYTAESFTKNFSWHRSYKRLHSAIAFGFSDSRVPVERGQWRDNCRINDPDCELIPMNFFMHTRPTADGDFLICDRLVELAQRPYDNHFALVALFAFHLADSGIWRGSKRRDGRVAGWANDLAKDAWRDRVGWSESSFLDASLKSFIDRNLDAKPSTKTKIFTNYRYMLKSSGVLVDDKLQPFDPKQTWFLDAVQLFWDRKLFDGTLTTTDPLDKFLETFADHEIYKLLACDLMQGRAYAAIAFREYEKNRLEDRSAQLRFINQRRAAA